MFVTVFQVFGEYLRFLRSTTLAGLNDVSSDCPRTVINP